MMVAVDFSEASGRAIALAAEIAARCQAPTVQLFHAESIEAPPYFTHDQIEALERQRREAREQAEQFLLKFARTYTLQPFTPVIADGAPVEAILNAMQRADLLVMGTHGRQGPRRWWLGSVAERVLRQIDRPLLIVHARGNGPASSAFRRALVHAPAAAAGGGALEYARTLIRCFGGEVVDGRGNELEAMMTTVAPTILFASTPRPVGSAWLSSYGEPLVRSATIPTLFVPEVPQGEPS
jgi:nucleotide-binding universal stress UspA family protein